MGVVLLSSLGGVVAFLVAAFAVIRAIFANIQATKDNTKALGNVERSMVSLKSTVDQHEIKIAVLEDRQRRR